MTSKRTQDQEQNVEGRDIAPTTKDNQLRRYVTLSYERVRKGSPLLVKESQKQDANLEIVDGDVILHRSSNFFVRTTARAFQRGSADPLRKPTGLTAFLPKVMPEQQQRIVESETRLMPSVAPFIPKHTQQLPLPVWIEVTGVVLGMLVCLVAHVFNMFNFPRYELDEGTYMSNAWAILHHSLSAYAYGYGHPPLGWIQIAVWVQLMGGFFTFGNALNTGRVLMLFYALGSSFLVYRIVRQVSGSRSAAFLAMVICSFSPLSLAYQRQVLLDNIGIFWFLLSVYLLVSSNSRLLYITGAALAFGIAILSKEIFLLFTPIMIYAVWLYTTKFQRKFALVAFIYTTVALGSYFVLMAILKGELFPYAWHLPWDSHPHLSLLDTVIEQVQRGQDEGNFIGSWNTWLQTDPLLVLGGIACLVFNLITGWWKRQHLLLALLGISFWALLLRGGVVFSFYIIPLIPLVAINASVAVHTCMNWIGHRLHFDFARIVLITIMIAALIPYDGINSSSLFTEDATAAQTEAMVWVRNHVPRSAFIVINSYLYMDLRQPGGEGVGDGATYPFAHVYFNVATDPQLYSAILQNKWDRIDYLVVDSEMLRDIQQDPETFKILFDALAPGHSIERAQFRSADIVITVYEVKHTTYDNDTI